MTNHPDPQIPPTAAASSWGGASDEEMAELQRLEVGRTDAGGPLDQFRRSLDRSEPPHAGALEALWWAGKGDWNRAHGCTQAHEGERDHDLVHAHLHRREGDQSNAAYWYRRAREPVATASLDDEWNDIARRLLGDA